MKKIFIFTVILSFLFPLCGCKKNTTLEADATNQKIASQICKIENYQDLSEETIKALSVVFRTNLKNGENVSAFEYSTIDEKILSLTNETSGETIDNVSEIIQIDKNEEWTQIVPKTKILEIFANKNESISSFANISLQKNDSNKIENLIISEKKLSLNDLKNNLSLKSNKIEKVETTKNSLIFYGKGLGFGESFDIIEAETKAKKGDSYKGIIKPLKNKL